MLGDFFDDDSDVELTMSAPAGGDVAANPTPTVDVKQLEALIEAVRVPLQGADDSTAAAKALNWMLDFSATAPLVDWACSHLRNENHLDPHQREAFERLRREGKTLTGAALSEAAASASKVDGSGRIDDDTESELTRDMTDDQLEAYVAARRCRRDALLHARAALRTEAEAEKACAAKTQACRTDLRDAEKKARTSAMAACAERESLLRSIKARAESLRQTYAPVGAMQGNEKAMVEGSILSADGASSLNLSFASSHKGNGKENFGNVSNNTSFNSSFGGLCGSGPDLPTYPCQLDLSGYYDADDAFVAALGRYIDRQFPARQPQYQPLVGGSSSTTAATATTVTYPAKSASEATAATNPTMLLVRGESAPKRIAQASEMARLRRAMPLALAASIHASARIEGLRAAIAQSQAQRKVEAGRWAHASEADVWVELEEAKEELAKYEVEVSASRSQVEPLATETVARKAERVSAGDYDLKLQRMDYAIDKMAGVLRRQQRAIAGHVVLLAALQADKRNHHRVASQLKTLADAIDVDTKATNERGRRLVAIAEACTRPDVHVATFKRWQLSLFALLSGASAVTDVDAAAATGGLALRRAEELGDAAAGACTEREVADMMAVESSRGQERLLASVSAALMGSQDVGSGWTDTTTAAVTVPTGLLPSMSVELSDAVGKLLQQTNEQTAKTEGSVEQKCQTLAGDAHLQAERRLFVDFYSRPAELTPALNKLQNSIDVVVAGAAR